MNTDQGSKFTSFAWTDRLKRVGTRISMDGKRRCIDNIFIERLWRCLKYECVHPPPLAMVALRVTATHQLSGALDNFSALVMRRSLDWKQGTGSWIARPTSNPASLYRFALRAPFNPRRQRDDQIDLELLADWQRFCQSKQPHYNRVLDQAGSTLREARAEIAAAGRAAPRHDGRKWGVVIDRPEGLIVDHISPRNSWDFNLRRTYTEKPHAWIVPFNEEENDLREARRIARRPGYEGDITLTEELSLPGLTNAAIVWREATRRFHEADHRPDVIEVTQEGLLRVATRADRVALNHYVLRQTQQLARFRSVHGQLLGLDNLITMAEGADYGLRFRVYESRPPHMAPDTIGQSVVRSVRTVSGETELLALTGTGPVPAADDAADDIVHFGIMGQDSFDRVVTSIEATTDQCAIIRAVAAADIIDELADAAETPPWPGRGGAEIGAKIGENTMQPPAPRFSGVSFGAADTGEAGIIFYSLVAGCGPVSTASFEIGHRAGMSGSWTTGSIPAANGGVSIDQPAALDQDAICIAPLLGGALIPLSTGDDVKTARIQVSGRIGMCFTARPIPSARLRPPHRSRHSRSRWAIPRV